MSGIIFPLFDADGIRLTSLRLGPPSAVTYANWIQQGGRAKLAFQEPPGDAEFINAVNDFITYANANLADLGLVAADMTPITTAFAALQTSFPATITNLATYRASVTQKDADRAATRAAMRPVEAKMEGSGMLSDAERNSLHMTVEDTIRTATPIPTTKPVGKVDTSQRLQHVISFVDESTPTSRAKPAGVLGCEIYVKIGGAPPTDSSEVTFLATDSRSPYLATYSSEEAGQIAHYMLRWVNTRLERGPWSETVSATIGA